jgi:hypothetical protein
MSESPFLHVRATSGARAWARTDLAASLAAASRPLRLAIVGPSRAGKTTLAHLVAERMGAELVIVDCRQSFAVPAFAAALQSAAMEGSSAVRAAAAQAGSRTVVDPFAAALADEPPADELASIVEALAGLDSPPVLALDNCAHLGSWDKPEIARLASALASWPADLMLLGSSQTLQAAKALGLDVQAVDLGMPATLPGEGEVAAGLVAAAAAQSVAFEAAAAQAVARLARCHLASCQRLAGMAHRHADGQAVNLECVRAAWDELMASEHVDFAAPFTLLLAGSAQEQRLARTLCLVADNAGSRLRSDDLAQRYSIGASGRMAIQRDLKRLQTMDLVERDGQKWRLADPLLEAWLRGRSPWV